MEGGKGVEGKGGGGGGNSQKPGQSGPCDYTQHNTTNELPAQRIG